MSGTAVRIVVRMQRRAYSMSGTEAAYGLRGLYQELCGEEEGEERAGQLRYAPTLSDIVVPHGWY